MKTKEEIEQKISDLKAEMNSSKIQYSNLAEKAGRTKFYETEKNFMLLKVAGLKGAIEVLEWVKQEVTNEQR